MLASIKNANLGRGTMLIVGKGWPAVQLKDDATTNNAYNIRITIFGRPPNKIWLPASTGLHEPL